MTLIVLTMVGSAFGGLGGALSSGMDGLILGGSIGFVAGASIWSLASMGRQWQRERQLDRYFTEMTRDRFD